MRKAATTPQPLTTLDHPPRIQWAWDFGPILTGVDTGRLLALLGALVEAGALGAAAKTAHMSYRTAWGLLRQCEAALGAPLVIMARGRGTVLSELGVSLLQIDTASRQALAELHAPWERRMEQLMAPVLRAAQVQPKRLQVWASHDLALADWVEHGRAHRQHAEFAWRGSEEALAALGRDECDVAGFHVPESWTADQLNSWLGRWLKARLHICLPLMRRCQGLLVARGNPFALTSLADIQMRGARMVNRQRGSGTRSLIDQLLAANGLNPESIDGYAHEEFTHDAVAATIAAGQADVGFGIEAAAARYDLDFVPLVSERYGFALRANLHASEPWQVLWNRLNSNTFRQRLAALPGYSPLAIETRGAWEEFLR
jgi:molybdate transport repressor ModE-like protein